MTRWTLGTTPDDRYGVYCDGELWFVSVSTTGEAETECAHARMLVDVLNGAEDEVRRRERMARYGR